MDVMDVLQRCSQISFIDYHCCFFIVFFFITIGVEVIVYDGNLTTVLLIFRFQGGLRNSKHECTLSSQEYVHELRSGITEEKLLNCLESLRVSLTSNPVRLVTQAFFFFLHTAKCASYLGIFTNATVQSTYLSISYYWHDDRRFVKIKRGLTFLFFAPNCKN